MYSAKKTQFTRCKISMHTATCHEAQEKLTVNVRERKS